MLPWSLKSQSDLLTVDATMIPDIPIYNWSKSLFDFISTKTAVWLMHTNRKIWILIFNPELTTKVITKRQKSIKPHVKVGVTVENTHHSEDHLDKNMVEWTAKAKIWKAGFLAASKAPELYFKNLKGRFSGSKQSTRTVSDLLQMKKREPLVAFANLDLHLCMHLSAVFCLMLICVCICLLLLVLC